MTHGTLETIDGRPALRFERRLDHTIERVWRAITDPAELARWFVAPVKWTPALGESLAGMGETGEITELEEPHVIAWNWGGEDFRFELRPHGHDCVLVFMHIFDDRSLGAQHAAGWEAYLRRLDVHLEGAYLSEEDAHDGIADVHERYAEQFGLDPEVGRRMFAAMHGQTAGA